MPLTGYLKIDDIAGESVQADHAGEIDVFGVAWGVEQAVSSLSGRARSRADMGPLVVHKYFDAASPYLARAVEEGRAFPDIVFTVRKTGGQTNLDYLTITMSNCVLVSYSFANEDPDEGDERLIEQVEIDFERMEVSYLAELGGGSAGAEHSVTLGGSAQSVSLRKRAAL
jgi:type VI secretion system secreted protein Hcp